MSQINKKQKFILENKGIKHIKISFFSLLFFLVVLAVPKVQAMIIFQNDDFEAVYSTGIILNSDDESIPTADIAIQFGTTLAETISWDNLLTRFVFSDDIDVSNNQIFQFRAENVSAMPGGGLGLGVSGTGRIVELTLIDSVAPGCTGPSCSPGTYSWNGAIWKPLQGTITTSNATKIVTVGPIARDYTTVADAATYCNTLSGCEIWIDSGSYPVTTSVDLENIRIVGADIGQTTISVTGLGSLLVKDTKFRDLTLNVNPTASFALDVKYNATSNSTVEFDQVDFIVAASKVLMDSSAGTSPTTVAQLINCKESSGTGTLVAAIAPSNLGVFSTFTVIDQTGLNSLNLVDWNVTIIGGSNVLTSGIITTIPDRTVFVSPGMNIQAAINSLGASGGVIKLGIGTHDIVDSVSFSQDNIELVGEGPGTILRALAGSWIGGTSVNDCVVQVGLSNGTSPRSNVNVRNFKLQVGPNIHGVCINGGSENKVLDMTIESIGAKVSTRTAMVFTDGAAAAGSRFTASRNIISTSTGANRWVDGMHFDGNALLAGQLFGYGNGISDSIISENIVNEAKETSYAFAEVNASGIFSNRARNIGYTAGALGVYLNNSSDVMIINNTMEGNNIAGATGIVLDVNVDNAMIVGNAVRGGPIDYDDGVDIQDATSEENTVTDNQFNNVATRVTDNGTSTKLETNHKRSTSNPTINDDVNDGFDIGTLWLNTATDISFILLDSAPGAAIWTQIQYNFAQATAPVACGADYTGRQFMDTDNGILYICDTSNSRNKWLSVVDSFLFGEENGTCVAGADIGSSLNCAVDFGGALGGDTSTDLGVYIPYPITITGYGFSEDNDACTSGSFDVEVWTTPSNSDDNTYSLAATPASGLNGQAHNARNLNIDLQGNQYMLIGIDNNCGQAIDDFNVIIYYRYRQ